MPYEIVEQKGEYCISKKDTGEIVKGSCHADKAMTEKMMAALYASEKMSSEYLMDAYVSVQPGQPYRLLPFGAFVKGGKRHVITPELAKKFKLPHFHPPIKLGSHEQTTPAGGQIVGLEVRDDGLYAIPELVPAGEKALADGAYRYHSPEIVWADSGYEDPQTGETITGPLIVGDALLHTPHLGEATAFYSAEIISTDKFEFASDEQRKAFWGTHPDLAEDAALVGKAKEIIRSGRRTTGDARNHIEMLKNTLSVQEKLMHDPDANSERLHRESASIKREITILERALSDIDKHEINIVDERSLNIMAEETVQVPKGLWEKFTAWIGKRVDEPEKPEKPAEPPAPVAPDEFKAQLESANKERDALKAQLDALNADKAKAARVETFAAQLKETKVTEGADILAGMSDEQAAWVVSQFKALSARVDASALFSEKGTSGGGAANPLDALNAAIQAKAAETKTDYATALNALRSEKPELFKV